MAKKVKESTAFGERLSELRQAKQLNMTALAELAGVSEAYISMLESGGRHPSRKLVRKLSEVLADPTQPLLEEQLLLLADYATAETAQQGDSHYAQLLQQKNIHQFGPFMTLVKHLIKSGDYALAQRRIEEGFKLFQEHIQLQLLIAYLELSRQDYEASIVALQAALQFKERFPESDISRAEILLNLGVMYFYQGSASRRQMQVAEAESRLEDAQELQAAALAHFLAAEEQFLAALAEEPHAANILDEYARLCFNLADLLPPEQAQKYWAASIASFEAMLACEDLHDLSEQERHQSACFLGHAYTKSGQFEAARQRLFLLRACVPELALVHYVLACHYALNAQAHSEQAETLLDKALRALKEAVRLQPGLHSQLWLEEDLAALREAHGEALNGLNPV